MSHDVQFLRTQQKFTSLHYVSQQAAQVSAEQVTGKCLKENDKKGTSCQCFNFNELDPHTKCRIETFRKQGKVKSYGF